MLADRSEECWIHGASMSEAKKSKAQVFGARLFSTVLLAVIVSATFFSGNAWAFMGLIAFLSIASSLEYFRMTKLGEIPCMQKWGVTLSALYAISVGIVFAREGVSGYTTVHYLDMVFISILVLGAFIWQLRKAVDGMKPLIEVATTVLGFIYIPILFGFVAKLCFLPGLVQFKANMPEVPGAWLVLWVVAVTKCTDIGAYCTGTLIGKNKMIPHISPGKTWEGFYGSIVISLGVGCALYAWKAQELAIFGGWAHVIILGVLLPLLTVVGDLAESVIKRSLSVKDSGNTLPGIGGALDLIDSICFTAPVAFLYLMWFV